MEQMKPDTELAIFHAVVEAGSFSGAARQLGITHSAVSKRIARLEQRLGTALLVRSTRQMRLTEAGEAYAGETRELLARLRQVEQEITEGTGALRGRIRITAPTALGKQQLMPLLLAFMDDYPAVEIDLTLTDAIVDLVHEGMDLAVRSAFLDDSGLIARRLTTHPRLICAAPGYLARHGWPASPGDLARHTCLFLNLSRGISMWGLRESPRGQPGFLSNSLETLHAACLHGRGIACLPRYMVAEDLAAERLHPLLDAYRDTQVGTAISILRPETSLLPRRVRALIDYLVEHFP